MEYRAELVYPYGDFVGTDSINFIIEVLEETYQLFWLDVFKHSHLEILYFRNFRFRILSNLDLKGMTRTFLFFVFLGNLDRRRFNLCFKVSAQTVGVRLDPHVSR